MITMMTGMISSTSTDTAESIFISSSTRPDPRLYGAGPVLVLDRYQLLYSVPEVMPARPSTVAKAPLTAEAAALLTVLAAALVPVFFFVEELFCVFRVEVTLLPLAAPPPPEVSV